MLTKTARAQQTLSRFFSSRITRQLPVKDLSIKEHDPDLHQMIEKEKLR